MLPEEGELIPVLSLKVDFATNDVKEATASQTERIAPFQNGPFATRDRSEAKIPMRRDWALGLSLDTIPSDPRRPGSRRGESGTYTPSSCCQRR